MSRYGWRVEDAEQSWGPSGIQQGGWVSLHYLRSALRRRWRLVFATTTAGLLLAVAMLTLLPSTVTASSTVLLAHDSTVDATTAIATDQSLLTTRTVARGVIDQLHLSLTPQQMLSTFTTSQKSTQLLEIDLKASSRHEAVARLSALTSSFLTFRNAQLRSQAQSVVTQDGSRIRELQRSASKVTSAYDQAVAADQRDRATQLLAQRSQLDAEIGDLQQTIEDTTVQANSVAVASHVVDPAAVVPGRPLRHLVLALMSGLIGGLGLGLAIVFAFALISNRLRRRDEVATALNSTVRYSVGIVRGWTPWGRRTRRSNLAILVSGLQSAIEPAAGRHRLALVGVGDTALAARVLAGVAAAEHERGRRVFLVDLTAGGELERIRTSSAMGVYRPQRRHQEPSSGVLALAASSDAVVPQGDPRHEQWTRADLVLVLGDMELGVGTQHLSGWADRAVVIVQAGRVTAEFLRSAARMMAMSGPELLFAMLVGADGTDESVGIPPSHMRDEPAQRAGG